MTLSTTRPTSTTQWPGLFELPSGPRNAVASPIAKRLFRAAVARLDVTVEIAVGPGRREVLGRGGPDDAGQPSRRVLRPDRPRRPDRLRRGLPHRRVGRDDAPRRFLTVLAAEIATLVPERLQRARAFVVAKRPHFHRPDEHQSRELIAHHYDLSNDLFQLFLDPTHELLLRRCSRPTPRRHAGGPGGPRGGAGPQDRAAARRDRRRRGHPGARDRHRLGRARAARRPPRRPRPLGHPLDRAARAGRASASPRPASPTGSRSSCATTARSRPPTPAGSTTPWCRSR